MKAVKRISKVAPGVPAYRQALDCFSSNHANNGWISPGENRPGSRHLPQIRGRYTIRDGMSPTIATPQLILLPPMRLHQLSGHFKAASPFLEEGIATMFEDRLKKMICLAGVDDSSLAPEALRGPCRLKTASPCPAYRHARRQCRGSGR